MTKDRSKLTCPRTRHRLRLQLYVPEGIVRTHRQIPLVQTLHRYDDGVVETRFEADLATTHPLWCSRTPLDFSLKAKHTFFADGRIDTTTMIVGVKEQQQPYIIDLTNDTDEECEDECKEQSTRVSKEKRSEQSSTSLTPNLYSPPSESEVTSFPCFFFCLSTNTIFVFTLTPFCCLYT